MANQYATVVHRWFDEVWNQGREETIEELMADDAILHGIDYPEGNPVREKAPFKAFYHQFRAAFPDIHIVIEDCLVDGDKVAVRCVVTGTFAGLDGAALAKGKRMSFTGICIARLRDGKLVEAWNSFDFLSMYQQLGMQLK